MSIKTVHAIIAAAGLLLSGIVCAEECQLTVSQAEVNYQQIRRDDIVSTQQNWHKLAEREVNVNVSCPEPRQMAVLMQGASGEKGRVLFGARGGIGLKIDNVTVDGRQYSAGKTTDRLNFTPESGATAPVYLRNSEAAIALDNHTVPEGKQMNFTVTLFPVLNDSMFNGNTDNTVIDN